MRTDAAKILMGLYRSGGKVLTAEAVVGEARPISSPLHDYFEWDDSIAAQEYRLWQARELIVKVQFELKEAPGARQIFVSLRTDRGQDGGGYRAVRDVLKDPEMRAQLLREAKDDLKRWREKYRELTELASVFEAADKL